VSLETPEPNDSVEHRLRNALAFAASEIEDMLTYVPKYFRWKWKYDDSLAAIRKTLRETT
jgi:hypothetical protein